MKINWFKWISMIANIAALIYLLKNGVEFWKAFVLLFIVLITNYADGRHRGRNENAL